MYKIAVVDDNADNRLIIRTILEDQFEIIEFASGVEAIEGFKKTRPDVVILDLRMPGPSGLDLLGEVGERQPDAQTILLTAHGNVDTAVEAMIHAIDCDHDG